MTSTLNLFGNLRNTFTIKTVNAGQQANILCIGDADVNNAGGLGISQFYRVSVQDLNFIECSRNRIGTTNEARVHNVQFQSSFLFSYLLLLTRVTDAVLTQTRFLPSTNFVYISSFLSATESSVVIEMSTFSSHQESLRISGIRAEDADIRINNSVFANFSKRAIETVNGGNRVLSIANSMFLSNVMQRQDSGGAISSTSFENTIDNCIFENNVARASGGAIRFTSFNSSGSISRTTFRNNVAGSREGGGAIHISPQTPRNLMELDLIRNAVPFSLSISESEFVNNTAGAGGGAIFMSSAGSRIAIRQSSFLSNSVTNEGINPSGGALSVFDSNTTTLIEQCVFMDNTAMFDGGAVSIGGVGRLLTVKESVFVNNSAAMRGGAIAQSRVTVASLETHIENSTFVSNVANRCGAIEARRVVITSTTFNFNMAATNGGAGCFQRANIFSSTFSNNTAEQSNGGAILVSSGNSVESMFNNNSAGRDGGAVFGSRSYEVIRSVFLSNRASRDGGALIGTRNILDSNFENNTAGGEGGAVYTSGVFVSGSYFSGNEAESRGGAISVDCTNLCRSENTTTIQGSSFIGNRAIRNVGGVLDFAVIGFTVTLVGNIFDSNSAVSCGVVSLMYRVSSGNTLIGSNNTINIFNSTFTSNSVSRERFILGGGALCIRNATISIVESSFRNNMADNSGGVMSIGGSNMNIENSSFVSNMARFRGGVMYVQSSWPAVSVSITNSIFVGNEAGNSGGVFLVHSNGSSIDITTSTLQRNQVVNFGSRGGVGDMIFVSN